MDPCVAGLNLGYDMFFFFCFVLVFFIFFIYFFYVFFLSLLLQCKFANSTLLSLLSFSNFITPYDAQASSAFSALINIRRWAEYNKSENELRPARVILIFDCLKLKASRNRGWGRERVNLVVLISSYCKMSDLFLPRQLMTFYFPFNILGPLRYAFFFYSYHLSDYRNRKNLYIGKGL